MMCDKCNKLFDELWWLSDDIEPMNQFIKAIEEWVNIMEGDIKISLINLHELNSLFPRTDLFVAYSDCSGVRGTEIFTTSNFIKYIQNIYNDVSNEELEKFWINKLNGILN